MTGATSEYSGNESNAHDDEDGSGEGWQIRRVLSDSLFVVLITRNQQHCQPYNTKNNGNRVCTHQFETVVRSGTEGDNLEFFLVSKPKQESEPGNSEQSSFSNVIRTLVCM